MGQNTKIDWADATWNPVTGCLHGCGYCYARGIANRFGLPYAPKLGDPGMEGAKKYDSSEGMDTMLELAKPYEKNGRKQPYPMGFLPTMHRYKLDEAQKWTRPRTIFVCSMADLFGEWVPDEWIKAVFDACQAGPQHRYLFLTKNPARFLNLANRGLLPTGDNFWYGSSVPTPDTPYFFDDWLNTFASIEPIHGDFGEWDVQTPEELPRWIIVGAETGNRRYKIIPKREWVDGIVMNAQGNGIPVFMKESLRSLMGDDFRQEFPWEVKRS